MFALKPWTKRPTNLLPRVETPVFGWMPEEMGKLFNRFFTHWPMTEVFEVEEYPWNVTTEEKEKELLVRMELPGFEPAEVKVEMLGDRLTVEAEHREPADKVEKKETEVTERAHTHVKRVVTLPSGVELEKAEAAYRNGVLEVRLPRKAEAMGRRIEVKA